jgi:hypothetical protein
MWVSICTTILVALDDALCGCATAQRLSTSARMQSVKALPPVSRWANRVLKRRGDSAGSVPWCSLQSGVDDHG